MVVIWSAAVGLFVFDWWKCVCSKMFLLEGCFEEQLWIIGGGEYKMDNKMMRKHLIIFVNEIKINEGRINYGLFTSKRVF